MKVNKLTLSLTPDEMYELGCALEHYIDSNIEIYPTAKTNEILNDFTVELKILQTFVEFGFKLEVSKKEGKYSQWESNPKRYDDTTEWFKALMKQRRIEDKREEEVKK